jgi:hypothetical protein
MLINADAPMETTTVTPTLTAFASRDMSARKTSSMSSGNNDIGAPTATAMGQRRTRSTVAARRTLLHRVCGIAVQRWQLRIAPWRHQRCITDS